MPLGIDQILEVGFRWYLPPLWQEALYVTCTFWNYSFYPFPHRMVIYPSQVMSPRPSALPYHKRPGLNALP
jgi:hypothetical protein